LERHLKLLKKCPRFPVRGTFQFHLKVACAFVVTYFEASCLLPCVRLTTKPLLLPAFFFIRPDITSWPLYVYFLFFFNFLLLEWLLADWLAGRLVSDALVTLESLTAGQLVLVSWNLVPHYHNNLS